MNPAVAFLWAVLYYLLVLPVYALLQLLLVAVSPVWHGTRFVLLPFFHLGHFMSQAAMLPFRTLAKLETLYVYLGVAGIVGIIAGCILYFFSSFIQSALNLESPDRPVGRTPAEYRAARQKRKSMQDYNDPAVSIGNFKPMRQSGVLRQRNLLSQTILEEDTSES
ncbi:uncharacterized protein K452DRAFT_286586 [Aplosporella prunicola CBS 121167]|uniref:Uncharacterized protein n=1 Tax=Aplosporella prunicola CBS 121167 TaxID=1176127 RepID=A0A6A6BK67_9PEZI|nr:uncharacterized protein K452DRAFT_286586 [Aplosporella prunicola CBS 121167]KAF2142951.1 hypothetical protein K452DRAFT_286586 [Aplosporella prunicola CBS 121167]